MSISWQMFGSLNSENHKAMPSLHEFSSGQQPCMESLINQDDYDAMHLSPLPSYVSTPWDSCFELSIFHQQASSPSLVEQHPNGHSNSPLSQPFMPEHQESFMRTKMPGLLPTEALAYQPKTHAHARDLMQAQPEFPGDITFDDFHSPTDAFLTNFVEEENLQKETDQMNQPITDPNVTIHEQGTSAVSQEAQVNPIGLENYSTGKALSDPIEDQSDTSGAEFACKTRMRWTPELHECFVQAVEQLGGPDRATPKNILSKMGVEKLTIGQVKSHLQKYRERNLPKTREDKRPFCSEGKKRHTLEKDSGTPKLSKKESETLHKQWELQKTLHHQLNYIRAVQLQAEEHGRRLQEFIKDHNRLSEALKRITQPMPTTSTTTFEEASIQRSDSAELLVGPTMHHPMREEAHSHHVEADALIVEPEVDLGLQSLKRARLEKKSTSVASP